MLLGGVGVESAGNTSARIGAEAEVAVAAVEGPETGKV